MMEEFFPTQREPAACGHILVVAVTRVTSELLDPMRSRTAGTEAGPIYLRSQLLQGRFGLPASAPLGTVHEWTPIQATRDVSPRRPGVLEIQLVSRSGCLGDASLPPTVNTAGTPRRCALPSTVNKMPGSLADASLPIGLTADSDQFRETPRV